MVRGESCVGGRRSIKVATPSIYFPFKVTCRAPIPDCYTYLPVTESNNKLLNTVSTLPTVGGCVGATPSLSLLTTSALTGTIFCYRGSLACIKIHLARGTILLRILPSIARKYIVKIKLQGITIRCLHVVRIVF
ncbi:hypothetical protein, unlikely [Trypanosoma congolense IL3000]|uniref:Uncharacterized protein n=1 Tax=Trypanosoma congolense (strain IL3000) TaxID=1068625 RepID=F9WCG1_TRYCI|nr:hypothetical protein, unlikely [Trypanosoma congolense IL3000]